MWGGGVGGRGGEERGGGGGQELPDGCFVAFGGGVKNCAAAAVARYALYPLFCVVSGGVNHLRES